MAGSPSLRVVCLSVLLALALARPLPMEAEVVSLVVDVQGLAVPPASILSGPGGDELIDVVARDSGAPHYEKRHRPLDKSMAGAILIIGGLAMTTITAIYVYIQVTRNRSADMKV